MKFKLVVIGLAVAPYFERCFNSILMQSYKDWQACVVIDPMIGSEKAIERALQYQSDKMKIIVNEKQMYALPNIIRSINELHPEDDDVIILIDLDDWLIHEDVFGVIYNVYNGNKNILLTHGSWQSYPNPNVAHNNFPYTEDDFKNGIRKVQWRGSHLRTFRYKVYKYIKDEDLRGPDGEYFKTAWDLALYFPMLSMAGFKRIRFIPEKLYVYNQETAYQDCKLKLREQMATTDFIANKIPYSYRETF